MDYFKYNINEDEWLIYLLDDEDDSIVSSEAVAEVSFEKKEIYIRQGDISVRTIMHELWHVYMGYCYLHDTSEISIIDMEEITAALFEDKAEKIINRAKEIYEILIKMRDGKHE